MPFTCVLCHHPALYPYDLCAACHQELPILPHSCPRCAREIFISVAECGECLKQPPPFDATYAMFAYEDGVKKLILDLKFMQTLINAEILGKLLIKKILTDWYAHKKLPDVIIPIPLHPHRVKERGFNQAVEIARPIAKKLSISLQTSAVIRVKHTVAQATLVAEKRRENIKNAFAVNHDFSNQHVAILDDVITTGQTITEFARVLKKSGAAQIDVWACAKRIL